MPDKDKKDKHTTIEISTKTIMKILIVVVVLAFVVYVRDIVFLLFLALMFAAAIDSPIDWLDRKGVPRAVGVIFIYLIAISLFAVTIAIIIPPIAEQVRQLAEALPSVLESLGIIVGGSGSSIDDTTISNFQSVLSTVGNTFAKSTSDGIFSTVSGIFGGFFSVALVMVLTFYLVVRENGLKKLVRSVVPIKHRPYISSLVNRIQHKIGLWFRGQIALALVIFVLSYVGLKALNVPYALVLALLAGLLEIVPYIGPIVAAIPAVIFAFVDDPLKAVFVIILYVVIQQLENHVLVPKIMQKAVGLNPVIIIIALLIGAKLAGVVGLLLAIPVAVAIAEFVADFMNDKSPLTESATPKESK
ncbi:AI-2E family transporter [Patescibacteria group bacterium]